ncbi:Glutathione S-transferase C-terminal domain-containing protein [Merluccius polli]|uniref:Glutathione S-transferase C-terminal domain-containing protein n=1 Tax=Merluccius polli TaxID=89951 RepID=A0AA47M9W4_MERPO|nr:Glutathione S-transferase C-terminal domain-containing protein [Merluccius polli]
MKSEEHLRESLYLEINVNDDDDEEPSVPLRTSIVLFLLSYCRSTSFRVVLVSARPLENHVVVVPVPFSVVRPDDVPGLARGCRLPCVLDAAGTHCRAGLAVALRHVISRTAEAEAGRKDALQLLGFKKTCLKACAEVSHWTRLCELGIPSAVEEHLRNPADPSLLLPEAVLHLEKTLGEPVKVHNDDKIRRQKLRQQQQQQQQPQKKKRNDGQASEANLDLRAALAKLSVEDAAPATRERCEIRKVRTADLPPLDHVFAEGLYFTLTDVVLLPCIHHYLMWCWLSMGGIISPAHAVKRVLMISLASPSSPPPPPPGAGPPDRTTCSLQNLSAASSLSRLPLLLGWYSRVQEVPGVLAAAQACGMLLSSLPPPAPSPEVPPGNTTASTTSEALPTEVGGGESVEVQEKTVEVPFIGGPRPTMTKLKERGIEAVFSPHRGPVRTLAWESLPGAANPTEGKMSADRALRKRQQLNNLVGMVTELARPGDTIVDFCSGGGHVGLVLAHTLPDCQVILVENKEESLDKARERGRELGLPNIRFIQANLDYFTGSFHIGVALHACGVATDMVVEHCIQARAAFVVSPCCYGFVQNTVKFSFPRSKMFRETLSYKEHMVLCRFADQTEAQLPPERRHIGKQCMGLVDLDRSRCAEARGYSVRVMTMEPESCSPKNNMLVGTATTQKTTTAEEEEGAEEEEEEEVGQCAAD